MFIFRKFSLSLMKNVQVNGLIYEYLKGYFSYSP